MGPGRATARRSSAFVERKGSSWVLTDLEETSSGAGSDLSQSRREGELGPGANYLLTACLFTTLNVCLTNNDQSTIDVFMSMCSKTALSAGPLVLSLAPGPRKFLTLGWVGLV